MMSHTDPAGATEFSRYNHGGHLRDRLSRDRIRHLRRHEAGGGGKEFPEDLFVWAFFPNASGTASVFALMAERISFGRKTKSGRKRTAATMKAIGGGDQDCGDPAAARSQAGFSPPGSTS